MRGNAVSVKTDTKTGQKMKKLFGKNRKCRQCGEAPVLHVSLFGSLVGLRCPECDCTRTRMFTSMAKARQYWNRRNKG